MHIYVDLLNSMSVSLKPLFNFTTQLAFVFLSKQLTYFLPQNCD